MLQNVWTLCWAANTPRTLLSREISRAFGRFLGLLVVGLRVSRPWCQFQTEFTLLQQNPSIVFEFLRLL
jgi:hypothetical protein